MKKFLLQLITFFIFSSLSYIILLHIWVNCTPSILKPNIDYKKGSYGHLYTRISDIKNYNNIDLLFIGSSHAYRGFDTRIFENNGYKAFNLGSSSQSPIQTIVLLKRYLEVLNPSTVIYEVYPNTFSIDGVESSLDLISNDKNDWYSFKMALSINNTKTYNTFIYGLSSDLLNLNDPFIEPKLRKSDVYISGGYVEKKIKFYKPTQFRPKEISVNQNQLEKFSEIVKLLKTKNIELILVYAPISEANYKSYTNSRYFDSLMNKYSKYYNFNEIMTLNDSLHFYDSHHLNQNGVKLFNEKLIKILNER